MLVGYISCESHTFGLIIMQFKPNHHQDPDLCAGVCVEVIRQGCREPGKFSNTDILRSIISLEKAKIQVFEEGDRIPIAALALGSC